MAASGPPPIDAAQPFGAYGAGMYAIRVVLRSGGNAPGGGQPDWDVIAVRLRQDPQPGVEHVSLVATPPDIVAMTFVVADGLLLAEAVAGSAWGVWLTRAWLAGWQMISCKGDLGLGVGAAAEPPFLRDEGATKY